LPYDDDLILHDKIDYLKPEEDAPIMIFGLKKDKDAFGNIVGQNSLRSPPISGFHGQASF